MAGLFDDIPVAGAAGGSSSTSLFDDLPSMTPGSFAPEVGKGIAAGGVSAVGAGIKGVGGQVTAAQQEQVDIGRRRLDLMKRIDEGEDVIAGGDLSVDETQLARDYASIEDPDVRAQMRKEYESATANVTPGRVQDSALFKAGEAVQEFGKDKFAAAQDYEGSWTRSISEGLGSVGVMVGASVLTGPAAPVVGAGIGSAMSAGEALDRAVEAGATQEQIVEAVRLGALPGLTEQIPIETLFERVPLPVVGKLGSAVSKILGQAFAEGGQEAVQQAAQNLIERFTYNPDQDITEGVAEAAAVGAAVGGIVKTGERGISAVAGRADAPVTTAKTDRLPASIERPIAPEAVAGDKERLNSPRLTPEDRASPIPNDIIDDGKAILESIEKGIPVPGVTAPTAEEAIAQQDEAIVEQITRDQATPLERATLRVAGNTDEEIDVMSKEERRADFQSAIEAGVMPNAQDIAGAETYQSAAPVAAEAPPARAKPVPGVSVPELPEIAPVASPDVFESERIDVPAAAPASIEGQDIDGDWARFTPQSGTLDIPRSEMPQIKAEHRGAMVNFLNARGVSHQEEIVSAADLKPTQAEFSRKKVEKAKSFEGGDRSLLISSDGHVLDGHHQWLAKREAGEDVAAIRLNAPIAELLPVVSEFPSATLAKGAKGIAPQGADIPPQSSVSVPEMAESESPPEPAPQAALKQKLAEQRAPAASWVIRDKATGEVVMETFDRKKAEALNTAKYEAVPIGDYLGDFNKTVKDAGGAQPKGFDGLKDEPAPQRALKEKVKAKRAERASAVDAAEQAAYDYERANAADIEPHPDVEIPNAADTGTASESGDGVRAPSGESDRPSQEGTAAEDGQSAPRRGESRPRADGGKGDKRSAAKSTGERQPETVGEEDFTEADVPAFLKEPSFALRGGARIVKIDRAKAREGKSATRWKLDALKQIRAYGGTEVRHGEFADPIRITRAGIDHTLVGAGDDLILAATRLPDIIRTAEKVGKPEKPKSPLGKDRGIKAVHRLRGTLLIDDERFTTSITVKESNQGQLFYDLAIVRKGTASRPAAFRLTETGPSGNSSRDGADENIGGTPPNRNGAFLIREQTGSVTTEFVLTKPFVEKAAALGNELRKELDGLGLSDVGLRVSEKISAIADGQRFEADGRYFRNMIDIALDAADPAATLNHEALHALRNMGLFSDTEWAILSRKSKSEWLDRYDIAEKYGDIPDWAQVEEGIAHAYGDWSAGAKTDGIIARSFKRIKAFLEALRNALKGLGFKSSDAIFRQIGKGEVGARERRAAKKAEPKFSLIERQTLVEPTGIPSTKAVAGAVGRRMMEHIKRGKPDGESVGEYSHRKMIDYLHPLRTMVESAGGTVQDTMNAYLQARLAEDAALARIQGMHGEYVTPMVEALAKSGASLEDFHRYLYARHVAERNRVVGARNPEDSDFFKAIDDHDIKGASGWSTNEAKRALRELGQNRESFAGLQEAARLMRGMLNKNLLDQKKAGLISDETYELLTEQWKHYVPLRADDGMDANGNFRPGRGAGFDVRGKEFQGATGRFSEAENIPAWAVSLAERTHLRAEKNAVGKSVLRFLNHYDPAGEELAQVYWTGEEGFGDLEKAPAVYRRVIGKDGKVQNQKVPYSTIAPDMFAVKVGGKSFYIKFADEKVGLALKKMGVVDLDALSRLVRRFTGWQSLINTRANPAFVPINIIRDAATGGIHLLDEGFSAGEAAKILGSIPKAWGALWRNARGRPGKGEIDAALKEYIAAGGKIAFEPHKTIEDSIGELRTQMKLAVEGKSKPRAMWDAFVKFFGDLNDAGENGMRLAAYIAAREKGRSVKQAAFLGRDLTVDFKKHGEVGPLINSWFVFFNASIQGNYNIAARLAKSKKVRRAAFAIAASGVLVDLLNRSLSGEDDDEESFYSKMLRNEPWKFERQMVIFFGSKKGDYFTIPLPYGYNAIYHMGVQASAAAFGDVEPLDAIASTTRVAFDAFNPIGSGGSWLNLIAPTIADPLVDIATNENFAGAPISPTKFPGETAPDSQRHFQSTPDVFRWVAEQANKLTGGDEVQPGLLDASPDTYEHLWGYVSGGIGRFFGQAIDTGKRLATGDEIEPENVPWVRSFYGRVDDDSKRSEYYKLREEVQTAKAWFKDYQEAGKADAAAQFADKNRVQIESIGAFDAAGKSLRKIRKAKRAIDLDDSLSRSEKTERLKPLLEAELRVMNSARLAYARNRAKQD